MKTLTRGSSLGISARHTRRLFDKVVREEAGGEEEEAPGIQNQEQEPHTMLCRIKNKNPTQSCGEKWNLTDYVIASVCVLELFPRWAKVTTTEIRCSGRFFPRWAKTNRAARDDPITTSLTALGFTKRVQRTKIELEIEVD